MFDRPNENRNGKRVTSASLEAKKYDLNVVNVE